MNTYLIYDTASGEIECSIISAEQSIPPMPAGKAAIAGDVTPATHYVRNGVLVAYTDEQARAKATGRAPYRNWCNTTFAWIDVRPQEAIDASAAASARAKRDVLLTESDWTDTLSAKARLGDELYDAWQTYRQALRDVSNQAGFPHQITWPEPPSPT